MKQVKCGFGRKVRGVVVAMAAGCALFVVTLADTALAKSPTIGLLYDEADAGDPISFEALTKPSATPPKDRWPLQLEDVHAEKRRAYRYGLVGAFARSKKRYFICKDSHDRIFLSAKESNKTNTGNVMIPIIVLFDNEGGLIKNFFDVIKEIIVISNRGYKNFDDLIIKGNPYTGGDSENAKDWAYKFEPRVVLGEKGKAPVPVVLACPRKHFKYKRCNIDNRRLAKILRKLSEQGERWHWSRLAELPECPGKVRRVAEKADNPGKNTPGNARKPVRPKKEPAIPQSASMGSKAAWGMRGEPGKVAKPGAQVEMGIPGLRGVKVITNDLEKQPRLSERGAKKRKDSRKTSTETQTVKKVKRTDDASHKSGMDVVRILLTDENGKPLQSREYGAYTGAVILPDNCDRKDNQRFAFEMDGDPLKSVPLGGLKDKLGKNGAPVCLVFKKKKKREAPLCRDWYLFLGDRILQVPINGAENCKEPSFQFTIEGERGEKVDMISVAKLLKGLGLKGLRDDLKDILELESVQKWEETVREKLETLYKNVKAVRKRKDGLVTYRVSGQKFMPLGDIKVRLEYTNGKKAKDCNPALELHEEAIWIDSEGVARKGPEIDKKEFDIAKSTYTFGRDGWIVNPEKYITLKMYPLKIKNNYKKAACRLSNPRELTWEQLVGKTPVKVVDPTRRITIYHASSKVNGNYSQYKVFHEMVSKNLEEIISRKCKSMKCKLNMYVWSKDKWRRSGGKNFISKIYYSIKKGAPPKYLRIKGEGVRILVDSSRKAQKGVCSALDDEENRKIADISIRGIILRSNLPDGFEKDGVHECKGESIILVAIELLGMDETRKELKKILERAISRVLQ